MRSIHLRLPRSNFEFGQSDARLTHRDDGILLLDKSLGELAGMDVKRISEILERKQIQHAPLNSLVVDFACDFGFSTSGKAGGWHYRKGYTRQSIEVLLPVFSGTSVATLDGLNGVLRKHSTSLEVQRHQSSIFENTWEGSETSDECKDIEWSSKASGDLANAIEGIEN